LTDEGVEKTIDKTDNSAENVIDDTDETEEITGEVNTESSLYDVVEDEGNAAEDTLNKLQDDTDEAETDGEYVVDNTKSVGDEAIENTKSRGGDIEHGVVSNEGVDEDGEIATKNEVNTDIGVDDDVVDELSTGTDLNGNGDTNAGIGTSGIEDQVTSYQRQVGEEIVGNTSYYFNGSQDGGDNGVLTTQVEVETKTKTERRVPDNVVEDLRSNDTQENLNGGTDGAEEIMKNVVDDLDVEYVGDGGEETTDGNTETEVAIDLQQTNVGQDVVVDQNVDEVVDVQQVDTVSVDTVQNEVLKDDVGRVVEELNTVYETSADLSENQTVDFDERGTETDQNVGGQHNVGVDTQDRVFSAARNTTNGDPVAGGTDQTC